MSEFKSGDKVRIINDVRAAKGQYSCHGLQIGSEATIRKKYGQDRIGIKWDIGDRWVYLHEIELIREIDPYENLQIKETRRQIDVTSLVTAKTT
jgi:hypothetical protein